MYQSHIAIFS